MNAETKVEQAHRFEPMAAYGAERERNRKLWGLLERGLILLDIHRDKHERAGEDVSGLRAFLAEARKERFDI